MERRLLNCLGKFDVQLIHQGLDVKWDDETNKWISKMADPLSSILLIEQPRPWSYKDDDLVISTLSKVLGKKVAWISSFQDGWMGFDNRHASITGFLLGSKLKRQYFPLLSSLS